MHFTDFHIKVIDFLLSRENLKIQDILENFITKDTTEVAKTATENYIKQQKRKDSEVFVVKSEKETVDELTSYYGLIQFLKKEGLIFEIDYTYDIISSPRPILKLVGTEIELSEEPTRIYNLLRHVFFIPSPELRDFKERNYKTVGEFNDLWNQSQIKKSMFWTKFTAIASISISIILAIVTSLFNYYTYSNERKVEITAMPKADTIKTIIITMPSKSLENNKAQSSK